MAPEEIVPEGKGLCPPNSFLRVRRSARPYGVTKRMVWKARGDERLKGFDMAVKGNGEGKW